jgi:hypothetical protein
MQVLPILVASLLGAIALAFVLYPLYRRTPLKTSQVTSLTTSVSSQAERELTARTALQEVELDYQLGNLAETDYRSWRTRYLRRAALAMKSRQEREQELDEMIEEQLRRMKKQNEHVNE